MMKDETIFGKEASPLISETTASFANYMNLMEI